MLDPFLKTLNEKFKTDMKDLPSLYFSVPSVGTVGIVGLDPYFWINASLLLGFQLAMNALLGFVLYRLVVLKAGSTSSFLLGYGIIIPFLMASPFFIIRFFNIQNLVLMLFLGGNSVAVLFYRVMQAIHDTLPTYAKSDLRSFVLYFSAPVLFQYDRDKKELVKTSKQKILNKWIKFIEGSVLTSIYLSLLIPCSYQPFPKKEILHLWDYFYWGNLLNNYALSCLSGVCLSAGSMGTGILIDWVTGYSTVQLNDRPLFLSKSPSDFWGNRWNKMVHEALKRGVYLPIVKNNFPRSIAAVSTFIASGLMHEYVVTIFIMKTVGEYANEYLPSYGYQLAFFVWNGVVICLEYSFIDNFIIKWMSNNLPSPLKTALVLMTVMPIAQWFLDDYVRCGLFTDFAKAYPRIVWIS